jgi:hypothetical protein
MAENGYNKVMMILHRKVMEILMRIYPVILEKITIHKYTGKIVVTINCKDGGIGDVEMNVSPKIND